MTIIDPVKLIFAGDAGETISVVVKSENTNHLVTYDHDGTPDTMPSTGPQSSKYDFTLSSDVDPSRLMLVFHFSLPAGGLYKVIIKGDKGPTSFGMLVEQLTSKLTAGLYTFDVL